MSSFEAGRIASAGSQVVNTPLANGGAASGAGGLLSTQKDRKDPATDPQFGDIFQQIQAKYGAKPEKPREIKKTLGKDDFLRIMVTQMKNQDPTSPFKPEQMAAEMAQFTSVEQLQNLNTSMSKLANQNQPLERLAMTGMIGKVVTIDRDRFPHTENMQEPLTFNLPQNAASVQAVVISEAGETVLTKDLGALQAGQQSLTWDGSKNGTFPAKSGTYMLRIEAKDEQAKPIQTSTQTRAQVIGVSFEGNEPVFLVGNNKHQDRITMRNVVRIETGAPEMGGMGQMMNAGPAAAESKAPTLFTFQKGVGSTTVTPDQMSPEVRETLSRLQQGSGETRPRPPGGEAPQAQARVAMPARAIGSASAPDTEKGFPNGLHDADEPPKNVAKAETSSNQPNTLSKGGDGR